MRKPDPVDLMRATVIHLAEFVAVVLFCSMLLVWAAIGSGA